MFPHIQGVLALDTPFLGISPGVISYGAEGHYRNASSAYNTVSEVAGLFGYGGNDGASNNSKNANRQPLPSSSAASSAAPSADAAATPSWQRWGRYAMFAGAAGAVAAGGAAAMYSQRDRITGGWDWVSSHLAFVGCLARSSELRQRVNRLTEVQKERGIHCMNLYTCLGKNATGLAGTTANQGLTSAISHKILRSKYRTFCALPSEAEEESDTPGPSERGDVGLAWIREINDKASDEIKAHTGMFSPQLNPAFHELLRDACNELVQSINQAWYNASDVDNHDDSHDDKNSSNSNSNNKGDDPTAQTDNEALTKPDGGFMDGEDIVVVD